jgi:flavodoxin/NAD-dependent dihydropyrimidine dehydrogenase PreA subunit
MSRVLIAFFSQAGSTARIAEAIAQGLEAAGYETRLCRIGRDAPRKPEGYDLIGIGAPVYYYRLPFIVSDYLRGLPDLEGTPVFAFLLQGTYRFDAGSRLRQALARKGGHEVGYLNCRGAAYYLGHLKEGYLFSPNHPTAADLEAATAFGLKTAEYVESGGYEPRPDEPAPAAIYRLERLLLSRWLVEHVYSRLFRVDQLKCTACSVCVETCPTGNIRKDRAGRPVWGRNCLLCMSCEMDCPEEAVSSFITRPATRWLARLFLRYHVRHWRRDSALKYARVSHERGETRRLQP